MPEFFPLFLPWWLLFILFIVVLTWILDVLTGYKWLPGHAIVPGPQICFNSNSSFNMICERIYTMALFLVRRCC